MAPVRLVGKAGESDEEATDDSLAFLAAIDLWSLWSVSEGRFTGSDGFAPSSSFTPVLLGRRDVSFARAEVDASLFADPATPLPPLVECLAVLEACVMLPLKGVPSGLSSFLTRNPSGPTGESLEVLEASFVVPLRSVPSGLISFLMRFLRGSQADSETSGSSLSEMTIDSGEDVDKALGADVVVASGEEVVATLGAIAASLSAAAAFFFASDTACRARYSGYHFEELAVSWNFRSISAARSFMSKVKTYFP